MSEWDQTVAGPAEATLREFREEAGLVSPVEVGSLVNVPGDFLLSQRLRNGMQVVNADARAVLALRADT